MPNNQILAGLARIAAELHIQNYYLKQIVPKDAKIQRNPPSEEELVKQFYKEFANPSPPDKYL